jgi:hypothetical protein
MLPDWLEPELNLHGNLEDDYAQLYDIFCNTLLDLSGVIIDGNAVRVDTNKDRATPEYECSFIHFISKGINVSAVRSIDFERARRIHWIRPILEHHLDDAVKSFWYTRFDGEALNLWLHEHDFLIVLKKDRRNNGNVIVTAHHVEGYKRKQLTSQYKDSAKKLN